MGMDIESLYMLQQDRISRLPKLADRREVRIQVMPKKTSLMIFEYQYGNLPALTVYNADDRNPFIQTFYQTEEERSSVVRGLISDPFFSIGKKKTARRRMK